MNHTAPWSGNPSFPRECARAGGNFRNRSILDLARKRVIARAATDLIIAGAGGDEIRRALRAVDEQVRR